MAKTIPLETRAFGAEPVMPDVAALAGWVAGHRGIAADLHAYLLDRSLEPQIAAGITRPCAGGLFYRDRVRGSLCGLCEDMITDEIGAETGTENEDAGFITAQKKGTWCAIPARQPVASASSAPSGRRGRLPATTSTAVVISTATQVERFMPRGPRRTPRRAHAGASGRACGSARSATPRRA